MRGYGDLRDLRDIVGTKIGGGGGNRGRTRRKRNGWKWTEKKETDKVTVTVLKASDDGTRGCVATRR